MRKIKIAMKEVNNFKKVYRMGYCDFQYIMQGVEPTFYNSGVYGWNCDIYVDYARDIAITTGYRNMRGERIPHDIFEKYNKKAKEILYKKEFSGFEKRAKALERNREKFFDELNKLDF